MTDLTQSERTEIEAAAFRKLIAHLQERTDVQNIDLMTLAGFCRNCLARYMSEAASERGQEVPLDQAKEVIYGMPYQTWKDRYQK